MDPTTPIARSEIAAAVEAGRASLSIVERITDMKEDVFPLAILRNGDSVVSLADLLDERDARAERPRLRRGTAVFFELASFIEHVNRFKDSSSVIFACIEDLTGPSLTAVIDYHEAGWAGRPRWGRHRSRYAMPLSRQWMTWTKRDNDPMTQDQFAQFIDDNIEDLRASDEKGAAAPTEILTMARNLVIHSKGEFARQLNPTTGEASLIVKNENESTSTRIPPAFLLGIPVFEAGAAYAIKARMRLSMTGGRPLFAFSLYQPEQIKRHAFDEVRKLARAETKLPVLAGVDEDG